MLRKGEKKQKKKDEVKIVLRNTGIPRNYFLVEGEVINSKSPLEEIREKFPSAKDRARKRKKDAEEGLVDLVNAPERAASLIRDAHDKTTKRSPYITDDANYRRFVIEGPKITDGSYVETEEHRLRSVSKCLLPRNNATQLVYKLQK